MLYLQQQHKFDHVAKLAAPDGPLEILSKTASEEAKTAKRCGAFMTVDGRLVCMFRHEGALWLRFDDALFPVALDVHASWDLFEDDDRLRARFRLTRGDETLIAFEHTAFQGRRAIPGDMTPFVEEEDYDFMLLVTNVIEQPGRRDRFFAQEG